VEQLRMMISRLATTQYADAAATWPVAELQARLKSANTHLEEGITALLLGDLRPQVSVGSIPELLKAADNHRAGLAYIEAQGQIRSLLGDLFQGIDSDLSPPLFASRIPSSTRRFRPPRWSGFFLKSISRGWAASSVARPNR
jgi:hypothetical protein